MADDKKPFLSGNDRFEDGITEGEIQEYVKKLYDAGIDEGICQEYLRWFWRVYGYEIDFEEYLEIKEKTYW